MEERIIKLESISAMQDETIKSLHTELFQQQKELGKLRVQLERMEQKLSKLSDSEQVAGNERPPHW